jgi:hypothetical protein
MVNGSSYQQLRRGRGKKQAQNTPPNTGAFAEVVWMEDWLIIVN